MANLTKTSPLEVVAKKIVFTDLPLFQEGDQIANILAINIRREDGKAMTSQDLSYQPNPIITDAGGAILAFWILGQSGKTYLVRPEVAMASGMILDKEISFYVE